MIVTMIAVGMMQTPIDQVINMIAMRHHLVSTSLMSALARNRYTLVGIGGTYFKHMLIIVSIVWMVQMPIVQIVNMIVVLDTGMPTVFAMHMQMVGMDDTTHNSFLS
jgi:hypothetical protein